MKVPPDVNRSKSQRRDFHERCIEFKPHKMGMQIPYHLDPQVPQEGVVRTTSAIPWEVFRDLARNRESAVIEGHLSPDHVHMLISITSKILSSAGCRIYQGQKCHSYCTELHGPAEQFYRASVLGQRIFCFDSRP